jgi:hypothetical protein
MTATLATLLGFISDSFGGGPNGATPEGDLIADANGDLFGEAPPWRRGRRRRGG